MEEVFRKIWWQLRLLRTLATHTHLWVESIGSLEKGTRVSHKEAAVGGTESDLSCSSGLFFVILLTRVTYLLLIFLLLVDTLLRCAAPQAANNPLFDPAEWVVIDSIRESFFCLSLGRPMFWYFTAIKRRLTLACQRLRRVSPSLSRSGDVNDIGPPLVRVKAFLLTHSVLNLPGHARDKSNPSLHTAVGKKS